MYKFEINKIEDLNEIFEMYKSAIGTKGCTWCDEYPTVSDIENDIMLNNSYCLKRNNFIVAVAVIERDMDLQSLSWINNSSRPCDISRVCVKPMLHGSGIGAVLMKYVIDKAKNLGYDAAHLLVGKENVAAIKLYKNCGFILTGECHMYDMDWFYMERSL